MNGFFFKIMDNLLESLPSKMEDLDFSSKKLEIEELGNYLGTIVFFHKRIFY
jgi:hypothetical protein